VTLLGMAPVVLAGRAQSVATADQTAKAISRIAAGRTVLAPEPLVESLAAAGARVWITDPLDAFTAQDQDAYLDFLLGNAAGARRALDAADLVVTLHGSAQAQLALRAGYTQIAAVAEYDIDTRTPG
jgi:type II secretory pathway predicted ATPase ExeA